MSTTLPTGKQLVTVTAALVVAVLLFGSNAWPLGLVVLALAVGVRAAVRRRTGRRALRQGRELVDGRRR
ncbi:hypothetical protein Xcel_3386 (plasmid) [Xylanimonas cellulosilytica DSM 15894]|uniref:Uncharacterized protein n=1 Tax=Xylanimonas cellulosilytica (strain DSM 15894 / JCM 12276 / CECT 5975 / KCTC 9989 / LMG 20990 / NBRC 107835 / XIL07) TaxID=446471 RepID=D1C0R9_XYLCX|nr:hypothetical protein [Xylanimonas cellulosilytica]ACZ32385.1 hypothetical protein Xcel_3386 [Xylanimonas cellulosilytica DSM 15894]